MTKEEARARKELEQATANAITAIGHVPDLKLIAVLPDEWLREVIAYHVGPVFAA